MARADVIFANIHASTYTGGGVNYVVQKNGTADTFYMFFIDSLVDVSYSKSTDGGFTWSTPVTVYTGTVQALSIWYDRWSGISADVVHLAYTENVNHDILYRPLDISSDSLGTETTVFNGASAAGNGALTITVGRNGDIRVAGSIDAGAEDGAWSSTDAGATWTDTIADPSEGATQDQYFLLPGWNADTADVMLIFVDASANGLSVKRYDDSANSWAESPIIADGSFVDLTPSNAFPHVACFVDLANSRNIVVAWSAVDAANQDLRAFIVDDTSVTEVATNVVLNGTDDQGMVAAGIDTVTNTWYVFYGGKSDGSETFSSSLKIYYKTSTDAGATWSSEQTLTAQTRATQWLVCTPRFSTDYLVGFFNDLNQDQGLVSVLIPSGGGTPTNLWY